MERRTNGRRKRHARPIIMRSSRPNTIIMTREEQRTIWKPDESKRKIPVIRKKPRGK